jgi:hypothetical protein
MQRRLPMLSQRQGLWRSRLLAALPPSLLLMAQGVLQLLLEDRTLLPAPSNAAAARQQQPGARNEPTVGLLLLLVVAATFWSTAASLVSWEPVGGMCEDLQPLYITSCAHSQWTWAGAAAAAAVAVAAGLDAAVSRLGAQLSKLHLEKWVQAALLELARANLLAGLADGRPGSGGGGNANRAMLA